MILKQRFLAGFAMLFICLPLKSEVKITITDNTIAVSTDQLGVAGYKGCERKQLEKIPADRSSRGWRSGARICQLSYRKLY